MWKVWWFLKPELHKKIEYSTNHIKLVLDVVLNLFSLSK